MAANENSIVQLAIQIKNGIMKHVNVSVEIILHIKKDYSWNPSTCICENAKYLKSSVDDSKIAFDEIIYFMDIVSTNVTSIMSTNVTSTMLTNFCNKKLGYKMNCYILHTVLLVIM